MSKKKNQNKEVTKKKVNSKAEKKQEKTSMQSDNTEEKVKTEELLILEKDKNLRLFAEFENFRKRCFWLRGR